MTGATEQVTDDWADAALRAVSDRTRRGILRLVRDEELTAGQIAGAFPAISRPAVSQHLRVLHDAGLVDARKDGVRRLYRVRRDALADVARVLDAMWADKLDALTRAVEAEERA